MHLMQEAAKREGIVKYTFPREREKQERQGTYVAQNGLPTYERQRS